MNRILLVTLISLSAIQFSCVQEVEYELIDNPALTTVTCVLENDRSPIAKVFKTNRIDDTLPYAPIKDALVFISRSDGELYELTFNAELNSFESSFIALEDWEYNLEVKTIDAVYSSITSIPSGVEIYEAKYTHGRQQNEYGDDLTHYEISFFDDTTKKNYYQMFLLLLNGGSDPILQSFYGYDKISDPVLVSESLLEYEPDFFLFTDVNAVQGKMKIELNGIFSLINGKPGTTKLIIRAVSKEYYEFLRSWIIHSYNQNNSQHVNVIDDLDPYRIFFQSQPIDLYSNIEHGIGIFGAYTEASKFFTYVE